MEQGEAFLRPMEKTWLLQLLFSVFLRYGPIRPLVLVLLCSSLGAYFILILAGTCQCYQTRGAITGLW